MLVSIVRGIKPPLGASIRLWLLSLSELRDLPSKSLFILPSRSLAKIPLRVKPGSDHSATSMVQVPHASPDLPVLDFSRWLNPRSDEDKLSAAQELATSCREHGFALLTNHGVAARLVQEAFSYMQRFFAMPEHKKMSVARGSAPEDFKGYTPVGKETVSQCGHHEVIGEKPDDQPEKPKKVEEIKVRLLTCAAASIC